MRSSSILSQPMSFDQSKSIKVKIAYFEVLFNGLVVLIIFYYQQTFILKLGNHDRNLELFKCSLLKFALLSINNHSSSS